jgi:hypothetical protein
MTDSRSIPTYLKPGMAIKVSSAHPSPSNIRSQPALDDAFVLGAAPVGAELKVLACVPAGILPESHPYQRITDDLSGLRWWYVRYIYRGRDGSARKLEGWASETGPRSAADETTVRYLVPASEAELCPGSSPASFEPGDLVRIAVGAGSYLNLRSGPETSCPTVHSGKGLQDGSRLRLLDEGCVRNEGMVWWYVTVMDGEHAGKTGWVSQGRSGESFLTSV